MSKWCIDWTKWDLARKELRYPGAPKDLVQFTKNLMLWFDAQLSNGDITNDEAALKISNLMLDYVYVKLGRPRWYIDARMFELLSEAEIDADIENIFFPFDAMTLVFERGCVLKSGEPLRWIRFGRVRSDMCLGMLETAFGDILSPGENIKYFSQFPLSGSVETGFSRNTRQSDLDTKIEDAAATMFLIKNTAEIEFTSRVNEAEKIIKTAMLYYAARPELNVAYSPDRSDRYAIIGDRCNIRRVLLPNIKYIGQKVSNNSHKSTAPHYRGFVLRTLRNERFKRNSDGSFRTILIPPCAIHPELMEEA